MTRPVPQRAPPPCASSALQVAWPMNVRFIHSHARRRRVFGQHRVPHVQRDDVHVRDGHVPQLLEVPAGPLSDGARSERLQRVPERPVRAELGRRAVVSGSCVRGAPMAES
jgi:hypothetical protein